MIQANTETLFFKDSYLITFKKINMKSCLQK